MLDSLFQFYILLIAWMLAQCQDCDTGWFGEKCEFMCHCMSNHTCDINGQCPDREPCELGFFGPGCQYVDVLQLTASAGTAQYLRDGDDSTCNPKPDATVVVVNLTEPVSFTWFRMVLKDKRNMLNFVTTLNGVENCKNEVKFPVNDTLVDVSCKRGTMMSSLKISGPAAGSICSIYISGGRNVAIKQATNQTLDYILDHWNKTRASNAVDGNTDTDYNHGHCSYTDPADPTWWSLRFSKPQIIHKVVIYSRASFEFRLRIFSIETFDKDNTRIDVYNESYDKAQLKYEVNISTEKPIASFKVMQRQTYQFWWNDLVLTLCEVQAFGACDKGSYGPECGLTCSDGCASACHHINGKCPCKEEFSGVLCTECSDTLYGADCEYNCSDLCGNKLCDNLTGECLTCVGNRIGPFCQDCPWRYFGPLCESKCNPHCLNGTCDEVSGKCLACEDGYEGSECSKIQEWNPIWMILICISIGIALCLLLLCRQRRPEETEEED